MMTMIASKPRMGFSTTVSSPRSHQRSPIYCKAAVSPSGFSQHHQEPKTTPKARVIPLLSELVEVQSITTAFETLAGRSAMIGFAVAAAAESLLPQGLFGQSNADQLYAFGTLCASMIVSSALLAFLSTRISSSISNQIGKRFLEPVIASLTSLSRSQGSVGQKVNVDSALDSAIETVFSSAFVRNVFEEEQDDIE